MGLASYAVIEHAERWGILHDGNVEGDYETKEAAFEAAIAAASLAVREGHEVQVSVPGSDAAQDDNSSSSRNTTTGIKLKG